MISQHPARPTANINSMPSILLLVGLVVSQQEKNNAPIMTLYMDQFTARMVLECLGCPVNGINKHVVKYVT